MRPRGQDRGHMRLSRPWVVATVVAVSVVCGCGGEPREATSFSIFDRPTEQRDRAPDAAAAAPLRTQEQSGELRLAGEFRGARVYLGRGGGEFCLFAYANGTTGSTCKREPAGLTVLTSPNQQTPVMAFVAMPDGYTKAKPKSDGVIDARLLSNGYAVAFRGKVTIEFSGQAGKRLITLG